ncbi:phytanoyl-CoA dioxygenase family protein [Rhodocytophaga aerolata]|uniref:Phytanoyl-CoA dioxygenase family protein n=1 Tax=Rhodocytophaga aerolata TaxID=455078 RepID=A0ABT8RB58_9BACT|nr:phytanoyl-CoA dioxygenase family protein [Rhodocytophaga aerolata]MDO1448438.1 phytanoyl-CoA dioxygenase family protein [Rhodocytophaga aerolata]
MAPHQFTQADKDTFDRDGYVVLKNFFTNEEVDLIYGTSTKDHVISQKSFDFNDSKGLRTKLALWYTPQDDVYGMYSRCERMVNAVEMILGGQAAHYHSKLMQKEPKVGGAWEWHQDYGYWYNNGFLFPDMVSVMLALTSANKENGCLQVIKGSHKMGRVEHGIAGQQVGASMEKVEEALKRLELVYVELQPGDTLFFHCNILHRSEANLSENSRWSLISAYNLVSNKSYKNEPSSHYTPIAKVPDDAIVKAGMKGISDNADFLTQEVDSKFKETIVQPEA